MKLPLILVTLRVDARIIMSALAIIVVVAVSCAISQAQGPTRVSGVVVDTKGMPLAGVIVRVTSAGSVGISSVSDRSGHFVLLGLTTGQADISASKDSFQSCGVRVILDNGDSQFASVVLLPELMHISARIHRTCSIKFENNGETADRYIIR
jgi:hypothetical protein